VFSNTPNQQNTTSAIHPKAARSMRYYIGYLPSLQVKKKMMKEKNDTKKK